MLEESLFKTNFIGRDGFRWWIGQIAPQSCWQDQADGGGWGNRVKVRIMGYHPYSELELPNEDLPWAQVLLGVTDGSGACNRAKTPKIEQADTVLGFFLDGDILVHTQHHLNRSQDFLVLSKNHQQLLLMNPMRVI